MRPEASPKRRDSSLRRPTLSQDAPYQAVYGDVSNIIDAAKDTAARSVNAAMTTAYWLIGHRIVEFEQSGEERAEYGTALIESLAEDLTGRFGRGFSRQNLQNMRLFYLAYPPDQFSRHCLANSIPHPSRWASTTFSRPFRWPGGHTCASGRSGARASASSTRPRRCEEGGRSASSTGRSAPVFYERTAPSRTGPPCSRGERGPFPRTWYCPRRRSRPPSSWSSPTSRTSTPRKTLKSRLIRHLETFLMDLGGDFGFMGRWSRLLVVNEAGTSERGVWGKWPSAQQGAIRKRGDHESRRPSAAAGRSGSPLRHRPNHNLQVDEGRTFPRAAESRRTGSTLARI